MTKDGLETELLYITGSSCRTWVWKAISSSLDSSRATTQAAQPRWLARMMVVTPSQSFMSRKSFHTKSRVLGLMSFK